MSSGRRRVRATFWLLDAPDSLAVQSRAEPDGTGLGAFSPTGKPVVYHAPIAAYTDPGFAREAREVTSTTFVAHVRYASTGPATLENTHPFEQQGRLLAHNGVVDDLPKLEHELGDSRSLVHGDTDSERVFALITRETGRADGDVTAGIRRATRWIARELPVYALNLVITTVDGVWALRYPDTHDLFVIERPAGGTHGRRHFEGTSASGRIHVRSADLAQSPAVIIASEQIDEHPGWRNLAPGELVHIDADLTVRSTLAIADPPTTQVRLADLDPGVAASQHPDTGAREAPPQ